MHGVHTLLAILSHLFGPAMGVCQSCKCFAIHSKHVICCSTVRTITEEDKEDMANFKGFNEAEHLKRAGATEACGEEGFTTQERT